MNLYVPILSYVLKGGPLSFDRHLLLLSVIRGGENPSHIQLFRVQICNLPSGFMSMVVG